jgi:hypothetical protein
MARIPAQGGGYLSLGLHAPLVSSFIPPQPSSAVVVGALLFVVGATLVAFDVFRGHPGDALERNAQDNQRRHGLRDSVSLFRSPWLIDMERILDAQQDRGLRDHR